MALELVWSAGAGAAAGTGVGDVAGVRNWRWGDRWRQRGTLARVLLVPVLASELELLWAAALAGLPLLA